MRQFVCYNCQHTILLGFVSQKMHLLHLIRQLFAAESPNLFASSFFKSQFVLPELS